MIYLYKVAALMCMAVFYGFFFMKMLGQKRRGIKTNQMAGGKVKDKYYYTELLLKMSTYILPPAEVASIFLVPSGIIQKVLGLYLAIVGTTIFAIAIITMRDSWRAGIADDDDQGRDLVTAGIYRYSRNPAFLGFMLSYIGLLIMFFNPILLILTIWAMTMMHIQTLHEEEYLTRVYGDRYLEYKERTSRYAGLGQLTWSKFVLYIYAILFIWCILYFVTCLIYAGPFLSMIWIWPALAVFSCIRIKMLMSHIAGTSKISKAAAWIYRIIFVLAMGIFIYVEAQVVQAMNAEPADELDYVIVLGAGLRGSTPTQPLRYRIEKAYEYMSANENTILVASGGQGFGEDISEAQCIKDTLVKRGISADRILLEDKSTSTEENMINSLEVIGDPDASVGIITNGFHEYRANLIAENVGYTNITSVPAITLYPVGIHYIIREFFGIIQYMYISCGLL